MSSGPQIHRVVTGHDDRGHAVILVDDIAPNAFSSSTIPGFGAAVPWLTRHPIDHTTDEDPVGEGSPTPTFPRMGETVFRIAEFPPDSAYPEAATRCDLRGDRRQGRGPGRHEALRRQALLVPPHRLARLRHRARRRDHPSRRRGRGDAQGGRRRDPACDEPRLVQSHGPGRASGVRPDRNGTPLC